MTQAGLEPETGRPAEETGRPAEETGRPDGARGPSARRLAVAGAAVVVVALVALAAVALVLPRLGSATPTAALGAPHFVDETGSAGIDHVYDGDFTFYVGGGLAVFDCNDDGLPDVYLAGGSKPAALYRNQSPIGGALAFAAVHDPATDLDRVMGAYPLDIDGDGHMDLAVLRAGEDVLLRGLGDCRFERANEAWSFDGGNDLSTAFSATWEGAAGLPTLAIGHYLKLDASGAATIDCATENALVRPDPSGKGYARPVALTPGYCPLSMLFSDWDRSGRRDLRVSNDRQYYSAADGGEQLWRVEPGTAPRLYTDADGWVKVQVEGMGIASYDLTGDGYPDVYLTSQADNKLQTLTAGPSQPAYRDIAGKRGVTATQPYTGGDALPSTAWHPEFQDVNNDGFVDLFVSKGNIKEQPGYALKDPSNLLIAAPDGTFSEGGEAAGIATFDLGRGAALADLNLDGLPDLVKVALGGPVQVWRNVGSGDAAKPAAMGHWLDLRLDQPGANRDAVGAWIEVKTGDLVTRREVTVGGGHLSGQSGWIHFGLGPADGAEVRVQWPDGEMGPWLHAKADGFDVVERGATALMPWTPSRDGATP